MAGVLALRGLGSYAIGSAQDLTFSGTLSATGDAGAACSTNNGDASTITAGAGAATAAAATAPGVGGVLTIKGGAGGASSAACDTAGAGGCVIIQPGAGGAATGCGSTGGAGGKVIIHLPTAVNSGAQGYLWIRNSTTGVGVPTGTGASPINVGAGNVWGATCLAYAACKVTIPANNAILMIETT